VGCWCVHIRVLVFAFVRGLLGASGGVLVGLDWCVASPAVAGFVGCC
jgi:hypothetical protein